MMEIHYGLIELFEEGAAEGKNVLEEGAAEGKNVLEVTGEDVAAFVDELLKNVRTYTEDWRNRLNQKIKNKIEGNNHGIR